MNSHVKNNNKLQYNKNTDDILFWTINILQGFFKPKVFCFFFCI